MRHNAIILHDQCLLFVSYNESSHEVSLGLTDYETGRAVSIFLPQEETRKLKETLQIKENS